MSSPRERLAMLQVARIACLCVALALAPTARAGGCGTDGVVYVRAAATGANDGASWAGAFNDLQSALGCVAPGAEVWVAAGTYVPSLVDRNISFVVPDGVAVYGGFAGTETVRGQRDPDTSDGAPNLTTLYGGFSTLDQFDDAVHIVVMDGAGVGTVLDGFRILDAQANAGDGKGGGVHAHNGNVRLENLRFVGARAFQYGGAMSLDGSTAVVRNVRTESAVARFVSGASVSAFGGNVTLDGVAFVGSQSFAASAKGGAAYANGGTLRIRNARFEQASCSNAACLACAILVENAATLEVARSLLLLSSSGAQGGGIGVYDSTARIVDVRIINSGVVGAGSGVIASNANVEIAGAVFDANGGTSVVQATGTAMVLVNCTFKGNFPPVFAGTNNIVRNTIFYGNIGGAGAPQTWSDSVVQGGCPAGATCTNVVNANPQWLDPNGPDGVPGGEDDDLRIRVASPAFDTGNNAALPADALDVDGDADVAEPLPLDAAGAPRVENGVVDMGAYELQVVVFRSGFE